MVSTNMLEQPNFTVWLSKCLKNKLFSPKLSLKSQPVSSRRDCRDRKKATLHPTLFLKPRYLTVSTMRNPMVSTKNYVRNFFMSANSPPTPPFPERG